jgi:uncharacterized protein DUF1571
MNTGLLLATLLAMSGQNDDLGALPPDQFAARIRATTPADLVALGRDGVRRLGAYRARLVKQERLGSTINPPQTLEITIRPAPRAMRLEYIEGPKAKRKVIWTEKRPKEMLVREGGLLGMMSVWIDIDGGLAHGDTNHRVTDLGFGPLLDLIANDLRKAAAYGGHSRHDEGFDPAGNYCMSFTAPAAAKDVYAQQTRLCIDRRLGLPVRVEVNDRAGFLERYHYTQIRPNQKLDPKLFEDL